MKKILIVVVPIVLILTISTSPATSQDAPTTAPEQVVRQLAGIQESLDDLVAVLATMRRNQDAEVMLRRIEMHERRLAPLSGQLERNIREQLDARSSLSNIEDWRSQTEERIFEIERDGREEISQDLRQELRMAEQGLKRDRERLETLQLQQIELENALADRRDDVEILEDLLLELLD